MHHVWQCLLSQQTVLSDKGQPEAVCRQLASAERACLAYVQCIGLSRHVLSCLACMHTS